MATEQTKKYVFLITGSNAGLGKALAEEALSQGHVVIATARRQHDKSAEARLESLSAAGAFCGHLDVSESATKVKSDIDALIAKVPGRTVDILINNAGYLLQGAIEECSSTEIFKQFDINVFGASRVLQAVLPYMRQQRSGTVVMLGSLGGWHGYPGTGYYCATKACCSIIAEALRSEVAQFGIQVTSVEPGRFRTNFLTEGTGRQRTSHSIADYSSLMNTLNESLKDGDLKQPGDPRKGAIAIVKILLDCRIDGESKLPHRLALGPDAVAVIKESMDEMNKSLDAWYSLSTSTDCD